MLNMPSGNMNLQQVKKLPVLPGNRRIIDTYYGLIPVHLLCVWVPLFFLQDFSDTVMTRTVNLELTLFSLVLFLVESTFTELISRYLYGFISV